MFRFVACAVIACAAAAVCVSGELTDAGVIVLPLRAPKPLTSTLSHPNTKISGALSADGTPAPDSLNGCPAMDFGGPFSVGGQPFQLIIDTGSTTLALASSECTTCTDVSPLYTPSSTSVDLNQPINGTYLDGSGWYGRTIQDSVSTAGFAPVPVILATIDKQKGFFSDSTCTGAAPNTAQFQGIVGFAFGDQAEGATQQYWAQYINSSSATPNVFALQMCASTGGKLWLGGYDNSSFTGDVQWTAIVDDSYYVVEPADMLIGGVSVGYDPSAYGQTIVDSGTSSLVLPSGIYKKIVSLLNGNTAFVAAFGRTFFKSGKCIAAKDGSTVAQLNANLPPLTVILGNATVPTVNLTLLPVSSYIWYQPDVNGNPFFCPGIDSEKTDTVMGWSFGNQLITIHDIANNRIGFGAIAPGACPSSVSAHRWARITHPDTATLRWCCTDESGQVVKDETKCAMVEPKPNEP